MITDEELETVAEAFASGTRTKPAWGALTSLFCCGEEKSEVSGEKTSPETGFGEPKTEGGAPNLLDFFAVAAPVPDRDPMS